MTNREATLYIRSLKEALGARLHIVGFPGAGGSSAHFREWAGHLGWDVRLSVVDPWPLHVAVGDGALADSARLLLPELFTFQGPLVLVGHSRGAVLAYETAQHLVAAGAADRLAALVAMAYRAPSSPPRRRFSREDDGTLRELLRQLGGTAQEVFDEPELLDAVLDRLRTELRAAEDYTDAWAVPLPCPLRLYLGRSDESVPAAEAGAWQRSVTGDFAVRILDGGHFFPFGTGSSRTVAALLDDTLYLAQGGTHDSVR
ncbi:alpha/beta fold hydrolase [Nonomuraea sp. NPDC046802]|uniref:thioesterase II family protein n=1 Tax=Nonomuraea sp. NPDC046802 TaxID=3154919 RepID=UPI003410DBA7